MSSVLPLPTPSWSSARVAVSMAAGSAAAPGKSSDGGIGRVVGQHRQLGLGRPLDGEAEHAIADGHIRNALAELVDDAHRLVAQGLRELPIHQALALLPVARVDAGRAHRNPDLAGTRVRIGEIHDLEDLRAPELVEPGCLHHSLRSRLRASRLRRVRQCTLFAGNTVRWSPSLPAKTSSPGLGVLGRIPGTNTTAGMGLVFSIPRAVDVECRSFRQPRTGRSTWPIGPIACVGRQVAATRSHEWSTRLATAGSHRRPN